MAVAKPVTGINVISGSFKDKDRNIKRKLSTDTYMREKDGKTIIEKKPKRPKRKSIKQKLMNDRLYQVECMWKALTRGQNYAFTVYAVRNNLLKEGNKRVYDAFKTLGMKYELGDFLTNFCHFKIVIYPELVEENKTKIRLIFTQEEPIEIMPEDAQAVRALRG